MSETGLWLPRDYEQAVPNTADGHPVIWNDADVPDEVAMAAATTFFEENASVLGANQQSSVAAGSFEGSLLARAKWRVPTNVIEEIMLCRYLAERDDDVAAVIGAMIAAAFCDGYQHIHTDENTVALFDEIACYTDLDMALAEIYRELLIAAQVTTVHPFVRDTLQFSPNRNDRQRSRSLAIPKIGVIPAEQIRILDNDMFGTGTPLYKPATSIQETWLQEYFDETVSPARKAEMRRQDPVLTSLLLKQIVVNPEDPSMFTSEPYALNPATGQFLYLMNQEMISRSYFPKGAWKYPRPLMTRDLALLEAKRLLSIMDFALLQGTANYLVVIKKGTDQRPALPQEIASLRQQMRLAARSGVIVGDHRLSVEVITPEMNEMLHPEKRKLLGRKIATAILRLPDFTEGDSGGGQAMLASTEMLGRVITNDRRIVKRHVTNKLYQQIVDRNPSQFTQGTPDLWFPKIVLQGLNVFTDMVLKLRDRGDIPRKYAVEAAGYDYDAAVQQRKREKSQGDDKVLTPPPVPFTKPGQQPNLPGSSDPYNFPSPDSGGGGGAGRPKGPSNNGTATSKARTPAKKSEKAIVIDLDGELVRIGEETASIIDAYEDEAKIGRLTAAEQRAIDARERGDFESRTDGPLTIFPVNHECQLEDYKAVRLAEGASIITGTDVDDGTLMAAALVYREPTNGVAAQEAAMRWGFDVDPVLDHTPDPTLDPAPEPTPEEHAAVPGEPITINLIHDGQTASVRKVVERDENGRITGVREESV